MSALSPRPLTGQCAGLATPAQMASDSPNATYSWFVNSDLRRRRSCGARTLATRPECALIHVDVCPKAFRAHEVRGARPAGLLTSAPGGRPKQIRNAKPRRSLHEIAGCAIRHQENSARVPDMPPHDRSRRL